MSEKQSYRDNDDMPTERAVLEREWKAMRLALSMPRAPVRVDLIQCLKCQQFWTGPVDGECPHCTTYCAALAAQPGAVDADRLECLAVDIEAIDVMYRGDPSYEHDGYWMREKAAKTVRDLASRLAVAPTEAKPAQPAQQDAVDAELWRLAVRKGIVTLHSEQIDERNQRTRCSWMEGHAKACDISNGAHDAAISAKKGGQV